MDASERFLEDSKGLASEPPWGMTTGEAAAFRTGSDVEAIAVLRRALQDAIRGAIASEKAFLAERARYQEVQQSLDDARDVVAELRQRVYDLEEEVASYDPCAYEDDCPLD